MHMNRYGIHVTQCLHSFFLHFFCSICYRIIIFSSGTKWMMRIKVFKRFLCYFASTRSQSSDVTPWVNRPQNAIIWIWQVTSQTNFQWMSVHFMHSDYDQQLQWFRVPIGEWSVQVTDQLLYVIPLNWNASLW